MKKVSPRRANGPGVSIGSWILEDDDDEHVSRGGHRHARLTDVLREELDGLVRDELCDPGLDGVRVARVELSVDYRAARVYAQVDDAARRTAAEQAIARAAPYLRRRLAEAVEVKVVPALRFIVVTAGEEGPCE